MKVAQAALGPAAGDVAADGPAGLDAFEGSYGTQALIDGLVSSADVPGVVVGAASAKKGTSNSSSSKKSSSKSSSISGSADIASFVAKEAAVAGGGRKLLAFA